jgi:transcription elongation GreA/GreB family factor
VNTAPQKRQLLQPARDGEAEVGERLSVLDLETSAVRDYRLVAGDTAQVTEEEVPISIATPLGSALLGRHVGDVISVESGGQMLRLEVVEIDG